MSSVEKKSSIGGWLKSAIFEESDSPELTPTEAPVVIKEPLATNVPIKFVQVPFGEADPEVRKLLEKDINVAAKPAYSEFITLTNSMATVILDERTRFQAAIAALVPKGLTVDKILVDVEECVSVLALKEKEGLAASAEARKRRVGSKEQDLVDIANQLKEVRESILELEAQEASIKTKIQEETLSLDETEKRFITTCNAYRQELLDCKAKIKLLKS
jgi:hypothetical protein